MVWCEAAVALGITLVLALVAVYIRPWLDHYLWQLGLTGAGLGGVLLFFWLRRQRSRLGPRFGTALLRGVRRLLMAAVLAIGVSIFLTLGVPGIRGPRVVPLEMLHWFLFGGFGAYFARRFRGQRGVWANLGLALTIATCDEWLQAVMLARVGDLRDVLLDVTAWMLGVWLGWAGRTTAHRKEPIRLGYVVLWVTTMLVLWVGTEWLVGLYRLPYPESAPVVRIPSRWSAPALAAGVPVRSWWGFRFGGSWFHERERWFAWKQKAPSVCGPWYDRAFAALYQGTRVDPTKLHRPNRNCMPHDVRVLQGMWYVLVGVWIMSGLIFLGRHPPGSESGKREGLR